MFWSYIYLGIRAVIIYSGFVLKVRKKLISRTFFGLEGATEKCVSCLLVYLF